MRITARLAVLITAAATGLALAALPATATTVTSNPTARTPGASATAPLWVSRLHIAHTIGYSVAVSPDGSTVFATGNVSLTSHVNHPEIVAYAAATGAQLWQSQDTAYNGGFQAVTVSPDGSTVFATGYGKPTGGKGFFALTVAYNATTGASLWTQAVGKTAEARSITMAPDGSAVYVTGNGQCDRVSSCFLTAAYDPTTGASLWTQLLPYNAVASSVAASPDGSAVYVTGSQTPEGLADSQYLTVAYDAATGTRLWTASYATPNGATAISAAVSPDSSTVFVTGTADVTNPRYRTIAYDAATGARLWTQGFSIQRLGYANTVAVSPDGSMVFVTGTVGKFEQSYGTVAYNAATGTRLWRSVYAAPGGSGASDLAVSPDGSTVFVIGDSYKSGVSQYTTLAYDAGTGAQRWVRHFGDVAKGTSDAWSVAVSPDSSRVFVIGQSLSNLTTVAYGS
jgi:outer membrane protein assembly factor BamB